MRPTSHIIVGAATIFLTLITFNVRLQAEGKRVPLPAALIMNEANELVANDRVSDAIELLEGFKAKSLDLGNTNIKRPDPRGYRHYLVSFLLGNLYLTTDQVTKAITEYQWTVKKEPTYFQAWSNLAKAYFDAQRFDEAANAFTRAYLLDEEHNPEYLYYAAVALLSNDYPQDAVRVLNRIRRFHPDGMPLSWKKLLVSIYFKLETPRDALPLIKEIIASESGDEIRKWQEILVSQYIYLEMKQEAMAYAELLVSIDPAYGKWWKTLASLKLENELYSETLTALIIYSKLESLTMEEQKLLASLCLALEIPVEASRIYEDIARQTLNKEILSGLIASYSRLHQPEEVIRWISIGLEQFEDDELRYLKGNLLFELARFAEAIQDYTKLTQSTAKRGEAWLMLGYSYINLSDTKAAVNALGEAIKFPKQESAAREMLRRIQRHTDTESRISGK